MDYYWKKKSIVSFILAILVSLVHLEVSQYYTDIGTKSVGGGRCILNCSSTRD